MLVPMSAEKQLQLEIRVEPKSLLAKYFLRISMAWLSVKMDSDMKVQGRRPTDIYWRLLNV